eukprot:CAMPEP_0194275444 /NCGR_PEP_ID=MMETSP0169-20130528/8273_1 /TAXON_ID=218684 /ORGANISM="Corethron pennatum, Strain L29A3" /LENGTH=375 /DNA_ID=CAMNT_0039018905 /DNA_START=146 /DNA_END=1273 /DNA_ORIENTATION=+
MSTTNLNRDVACLQDIEDYAHAVLPRNALDYYRSGADQMLSLQDNRDAFARYRLLPRMLRDVSTRSLDTVVLNGRARAKTPIGVAPTAMQRMAHPDGELAAARAAQDAGAVFIMSTISTTSLEDVAAAAPDATKWFQLYIYKDRAVTEEIVRRAERAGFAALVLTVDAPYFGQRLPDARNKFQLPPHLTMANFRGLGEDIEKRAGKSGGGSGISNYVNALFDPTLSWEDVKWLQKFTTLPVILKGILSPADALLAVNLGIPALIVSNHGARQLDGVQATVDALGPIARAVGHRCELYLDGGVRTGTDVLKALALGARMVFVGRPVLWGLAYGGREGVALTLGILRAELDRAMGLAGIASIEEITKEYVIAPRAAL